MGHRNNFDFLRLLAAVSVWYGHCFALTAQPSPIGHYINFEDFGSLGVTAFFVISGYFVTLSYGRHNALLPFLRNRVLRIMPALVAVVLLSVFVLGPAVTTLAIKKYFADSETWRYLRCLLVFPLQYELPGVFTDNTVHAVNGSLWTLQHEVRLYVVIAALGVLGILQPRLMFALLLALFAIRIYGVVKAPDAKTILLFTRWEKLELMVRLASQFMLGAFFYAARERIALRKELFVVACVVIAATIFWQGTASALIFDIAFAYAIVYFGFVKLPLLHHASRFGDFSYGIYLYAFPMQQLSLHLQGTHPDFRAFLLMSGLLTLLGGILSWHMVEKPALRFKS